MIHKYYIIELLFITFSSILYFIMMFLLFILFYLRVSSLHQIFRPAIKFKLKFKFSESFSYSCRFLFFQLIFSIFFKIRPAFFSTIKTLDLFHPFYNQFLYSALFLHLVIKFLLFFFSITLDSEMNLILLLICISISSLIDIYHYITYPFYIVGKYCYTQYISNELSGMESMEYLPLESVGNQWVNKAKWNYRVDLYYFLRLIFMFFIFIRYWIIREPYFFSALNTVLIISYLSENNLFFMYIYLITNTFK